MRTRSLLVGLLLVVALPTAAPAASVPTRARAGMVVSENATASRVGADVLERGGNAVDAAVATAFALAVVHPAAGNVGGGGFLLYRPARGGALAYDFRETAPAAATPTMFLVDGAYDRELHHESYLSIGVPGTVAGLYLAWQEQGTRPWKELLQPAIELARDGFVVSEALARDLEEVLPRMRRSRASLEQFTRHGVPYAAGDRLRQPDLARTLGRIAARGSAGFYEGETAERIEHEVQAHGGRITREDLRSYRAKRREPVRGSYRGHEILSMPPPSSGGVALVEMLNILEGFDLDASGFGSADTIHAMVEAMRRAYADRALHLGDPDAVRDMPLARLTSKVYAGALRATIDPGRASVSSPDRFAWDRESSETTHLSVVDAARNAVALTYTLEDSFGSAITVPGAGFLLNNEMGDFNAGPGWTTPEGLIGTPPNLAAPGKRMLSSMSPTIVTHDGVLRMVTGSPGGRTIINTVLQTIVGVVDFGMNAQEAVDAPRVHHGWLPDRIQYERHGLSADTLALLRARGHALHAVREQGCAQVILFDAAADLLEGAADRRQADGAAVGVDRPRASRAARRSEP